MEATPEAHSALFWPQVFLSHGLGADPASFHLPRQDRGVVVIRDPGSRLLGTIGKVPAASANSTVTEEGLPF